MGISIPIFLNRVLASRATHAKKYFFQRLFFGGPEPERTIELIGSLDLARSFESVPNGSVYTFVEGTRCGCPTSPSHPAYPDSHPTKIKTEYFPRALK
jgi:hypothetical protein